MKRIHIITFIAWMSLLNWPAILFHIPPLRPVCFLPFLYWINIPSLWLGLAKTIGQPHYDIQEFGALPQTPLAWSLIVAFWLLIAAGLSLATALISRFLHRGVR